MVKAKESQKKCPHCAESIQVDAKKCRYCGEWLSDKTSIKQNWLVRFVITSLIWSVVLFAWFIYAYNTLDRSEAAYQHTLNTGPVLSGYSLPLLAAVLALLMRKQVFSRTRSLKSILAKLIVVLILIFGLWSQMTYDPFPFNAAIGQGYSRDEKGIRRSMERQDQLSLWRNEAAAKEMYQDFLSGPSRRISPFRSVNPDLSGPCTGFPYPAGRGRSTVLRHKPALPSPVPPGMFPTRGALLP